MMAATALLQVPPPGGDGLSFFFPLALILLVFYFLIFRPQQKRQKEHEAMQKNASKGDSVVTAGGIHGKVVGAADDVLTLEIANLKGGEKVRVKVSRARIEQSTPVSEGKGESTS